MVPPLLIDATRLRECFDEPPRTRFAPSPTGHLHLGHVVSAMYVWGLARAVDGAVLLRIEDHDRERSRPEYEQSILDDLEWLGFVPAEGWFAELRAGRSAFRQSDRPALYEATAARLEADGRTYWCDCSRSAIARVADADASGERRYPGTCRDRGLAAGPDRALRFRVGPDPVEFHDALLGTQRQVPAEQCGDFVLRDRRSNWSYQFAVVADDLDQRVNFIIRGTDLLPSTGRQLLLRRALGGTAPLLFAHHQLLHGPDGTKLSKSYGATGVRDLRAAGVSPMHVLGRAAAAAGLVADPRPLEQGELPRLLAR